MIVHNDAGLGHLTYCTNVHPGEAWPQVLDALRKHLPAMKAEICPEQPMGVGLRLAAQAADALGKPTALAELRELLAKQFYVFTINGFPYGQFHGTRVKTAVYRPDWREPARLTYSRQLADILAQLLPDEVTGSISTLPGTYRPWLESSENPDREFGRMADHLLQHAAYLHVLQRSTGKEICLALEPEPFCLLETAADAVHFFNNHLFSQAACRRLGELCGCDLSAAEAMARRHLGICLDVCHQAVMFEDPVVAVKTLQAAGIRIAKLQLSAALRITPADAAQRAALSDFDDPVYLHQTLVQDPTQGDGTLQGYADLEQALASAPSDAEQHWRCHFHVPVFLRELGPFASTQDELAALLRHHREQPICPHLEVETYTWEVLPARYRDSDVASALARELRWVIEQLG